jgi:hypothetical protein
MKPAGHRGEAAAQPVPATMPPSRTLPGDAMTTHLTLPRELFAGLTLPARSPAPLPRVELLPDIEARARDPHVDIHLPLTSAVRPARGLLPPRHREHPHRLALALEADWR